MLGIGLAFFGQLTGVNVVVYYCVATIFYWRLTPETLGRSLEEIEKRLIGR